MAFGKTIYTTKTDKHQKSCLLFSLLHLELTAKKLTSVVDLNVNPFFIDEKLAAQRGDTTYPCYIINQRQNLEPKSFASNVRAQDPTSKIIIIITMRCCSIGQE
jgi:hypothetical protein